MGKGLFGWLRKAETEKAYHLPEGRRLYAIGDIHGRYDLLLSLLDAIERDDRDRGGNGPDLVFLGDLINRGPQSREVIGHVRTLAGRGAVVLGGNHEEILCGLWHGNDEYASVFHRAGGEATMASYGVAKSEYDAWNLQELAEEVRALIPAEDIAFLKGLGHSYSCGDYLFVHAGIRPAIPLAEQSTRDMRWIRSDFTASEQDHGCMVVHGHTITAEPDMRANRIGIDTGAFRSGRLTALGLEGQERWFLTT